MLRSKRVANSNTENANLGTVDELKKVASHMSLVSVASKATISTNKNYNKASFETKGSTSVLIPSDERKHETTAPEILHLRISRDSKSITEFNRNNPKYSADELEERSRCGRCCFGALFSKRRRSIQDTNKDLDDLDPIHPRTVNSVDYIENLAEKGISTNETNDETFEKALLIQQAYRASLDGLSYLNKATDGFKTCILMLTFSQHSKKLKNVDKTNIIRGKTILGCYAWMATYMLQQMQSDPVFEVKRQPTTELKEIFQLYEKCVIQSVYIWEAMIRVLEAVEHTHDYMEKVFRKLLQKVGEQGKAASAITTRHFKSFRKYQRCKDELEKLKVFNTRKFALTWGKHSRAPSRILIKDKRTKDNAKKSWQGFDVQGPDTKFDIVKLLYQQIFQISDAVLEQVEEIAITLHTVPLGRKAEKKHRNISPTSVRSFEDGLHLMSRYFEESSPKTWSPDQIQNVLELDKICLDQLDLLTLSAATMRTITHEARHILHVTYNTTREFEFEECKSMSSYEDIIESCRQDFPAMWDRATADKEGMKQKLSILSTSSIQNVNDSKKKHYESKFDIEETVLEAEDGEYLFERSIYQDIIKAIPIVLPGKISLTLQDAELAFTESSHDLLSSVVRE